MGFGASAAAEDGEAASASGGRGTPGGGLARAVLELLSAAAAATARAGSAEREPLILCAGLTCGVLVRLSLADGLVCERAALADALKRLAASPAGKDPWVAGQAASLERMLLAAGGPGLHPAGGSARTAPAGRVNLSNLKAGAPGHGGGAQPLALRKLSTSAAPQPPDNAASGGGGDSGGGGGILAVAAARAMSARALQARASGGAGEDSERVPRRAEEHV